MPQSLNLLALILFVPWLIPNHYVPWLSFHSDWLAGMLGLSLCGAWLTSRAACAPKAGMLALAAFGAALTPLIQSTFGLIHFAGDAWVASLYVMGFTLSVVVGRSIAAAREANDWIDWLAAGWGVGAGVSVALALLQWVGVGALLIADLPPNGRPFANVAQPNSLSTICFLGLCGLGLLHQKRRIDATAFWLGASWMLLGMAITQSRTGVLQVAALVCWLIFRTNSLHLRLIRGDAVVLALLFTGIAWAWRTLNEFLLLDPGRSLSAQLQTGTRWSHWVTLADAIGREPWFGYGWNQVGMAQQRAALRHDAVGEYIEHSHNLLIDVMIWNGLPVGLLLIGALAWWFAMQVRGCQTVRASWLLAAVIGVFLHAMFEYPLSYAHFLIPVGLAMGAVEGLSRAGGPAISLPRPLLVLVSLLVAVVFTWTTVDYVKAEENHRVLRLEGARIGTGVVTSTAPDLLLLTQLREFLRFARTTTHPNMTPAELDWMRQVADRFGYPPVLFRYALAAGLNGEPQAASNTLARLCKVHPLPRCEEGRDAWRQLQNQYPVLRAVEPP